MRTASHTEIVIDAPIAYIWDILTQFDHYPNWNRLIYHILGDSNIGNCIQVTLQDQKKSNVVSGCGLHSTGNSRVLMERSALDQWFI